MLLLVVAALSVLLVGRQAFVPPPAHPSRLAAPASAVAGLGATLAAAPAFADEIGERSKKLADASYPLLKNIDWGKTPVLSKFFSNSAENGIQGPKIAAAVDATLKMGLTMDPELIKASVAAHEKAVAAAKTQPGLVTPSEEHRAVTESIARMVASSAPNQARAVFNAYADVGLKDINKDWFASVDKYAAFTSYNAFLDLKQQVKYEQFRNTAPSSFSVAPPDYSDKLGAAAKELADASYPLLKKIDWERTPVLTKWLAEQSGKWDEQKLAAAVDSTLKASAGMDQKLIRQAVAAHEQATAHAVSQPGLVAPLADHEAVTESIVRMLASAPPDTVKAVFDTYADVGLKDLNAKWFSTMDAADAQAAYKTFLAMSEVVKVAGK